MWPYIVAWSCAIQPAGVVITGSQGAFKRCDSAYAAITVDQGPGVTSYLIELPPDRYCWTVRCRSASALSEPSETVIFHTSPDTDGDGLLDSDDNCRALVNPGQMDTDGDGFGNRCDGDLNQDGQTNAFDTVLFREQIGVGGAADINGDGFVNAFDTPLFRALLGLPPGP